MESFSEFKKIIQKPQINLKSSWYARKIIWAFSPYITKFLVTKTNVSANQVTIWQLISSLIGIGLLCFANTWIAFLGVLFLHLGYIFDNVDGEVARYRKSQSINGMFLDFVNHVVMAPMVFGCIAFHYYFATGFLFYFVLGVTIILMKIPSIGHARYATINYLIEKRHSPTYDISNYWINKKENSTTESSASDPQKKKDSVIKKARKLISRFFSYPSDFLLISALIVIELITNSTQLGRYSLIIFSVYFVSDFALSIYVHLKNKVPEREFLNYVQACLEIAEKVKPVETGDDDLR